MTSSAELEEQSHTISEGLSGLVVALNSADLSPDEVSAFIKHVRGFERQCVAAVMTLGNKAKAHETAGVGRTTHVVLQGGRSVSEATALRDSSRQNLLSRFPAVARGVHDADVYPENLDVLARTTARMTDEEITELTQLDADLAAAASRLSVDSFRKRVQRYRDRIRDDHGHTAQQQAKPETFARVPLSRDKQQYRINGAFDIAQGTVVHNAHQLGYRRLCDQLGAGHGLTSDEVSAQALHDLILRGSNTQATHENNRPTVLLQVITDGQTLATGPHDRSILETADGLAVCPEMLGQLSCDCLIQRVDSLPDGNSCPKEARQNYST